MFANGPDFWITFPYHPNFGPILEQFTGFVHTLCECNLSPTGFLERTRADKYAVAPVAVCTRPMKCITFASGQLNKFMSA